MKNQLDKYDRSIWSCFLFTKQSLVPNLFERPHNLQRSFWTILLLSKVFPIAPPCEDSMVAWSTQDPNWDFDVKLHSSRWGFNFFRKSFPKILERIGSRRIGLQDAESSAGFPDIRTNVIWATLWREVPCIYDGIKWIMCDFYGVFLGSSNYIVANSFLRIQVSSDLFSFLNLMVLAVVKTFGTGVRALRWWPFPPLILFLGRINNGRYLDSVSMKVLWRWQFNLDIMYIEQS